MNIPEEKKTPIKAVACLAMSLDGKIAPQQTIPWIRLGSDNDLTHLKSLRDTADAVVYGAETFRAYPKPHAGNLLKPLPLHVIMTRSFRLNPQASFFEFENKPLFPTWICSPEDAPEEIQAQFPSHITWVTAQTASELLEKLSRVSGIKNVLVEGGGQIMQWFIESQTLDELHLTLCPRLLGEGSNLIQGPIAQGIHTEILSLRQKANEIFLHLRIIYPD